MQVRSKTRAFKLPTAEQERAIRAGIATDPDTYEVPVDEVRQMRPLRGRPPAEVVKTPVKIRLDPDVLAALRASGRGWQTRVNALLKNAVKRGRI